MTSSPSAREIRWWVLLVLAAIVGVVSIVLLSSGDPRPGHWFTLIGMLCLVLAAALSIARERSRRR